MRTQDKSILLELQYWCCPLMRSGGGGRYSSIVRVLAAANLLHVVAASIDSTTDRGTPYLYIDLYL